MEEKLNAANILEKKNRIVDILRNNGPSLPSKISGELHISLLLTSALLSEMVSEKTLKYSYLKIGGSPLYYLPGQEKLLDEFVKHLHNKEREVFELLKEHLILDEEKLEPALRVAIKSIKDFAIPLSTNINGKNRVFWYFHSLNYEEALKKIKEKYLSKEENKLESKEQSEKDISYEIRPLQPKHEEGIIKDSILKKPKTNKTKERDYGEQAFYEYLKKKGFIIKDRLDNDSSFFASFSFVFGEITFLVIVNKKKKINEVDLCFAYSRGESIKTPVLLLINGELTKKAKEYLEKFKNFLFVIQINKNSNQEVS